MAINRHISLFNIVCSTMLALLLVGPGMFKVGFIAYFHVNRQNITKEHCINQDRPELKCNGQCFFMQTIARIKQQERERENTIPNFIYQLEIPVFLSKNNVILIDSLAEYTYQRNFLYSDMHSALYFFRLLKPPQYPLV